MEAVSCAEKTKDGANMERANLEDGAPVLVITGKKNMTRQGRSVQRPSLGPMEG